MKKVYFVRSCQAFAISGSLAFVLSACSQDHRFQKIDQAAKLDPSEIVDTVLEAGPDETGSEDPSTDPGQAPSQPKTDPAPIVIMPPPANIIPKDILPPSDIPKKAICGVDQFDQPTASQSAKLDILFVMDTSGSLDNQRVQVADGIKQFVGELPDNLDINLGVMLAHGKNSSLSGRMYRKSDSAHPVWKSKDLSLSSIQSDLRSTLVATAKKDDFTTDGGEAGLVALTRALQGENLAQNQAQGMFRADAHLAIIFVADENDICTIDQVPQRKQDGNLSNDPITGKLRENELIAYDRECFDANKNKLTPESVYQLLMALRAKSEKKVSTTLAGIIYDNLETAPSSRRTEQELSWGYLNLIQLGKGVTADLATMKISDSLKKIAEITAEQIQLITQYILKGSTGAINASSIEVRIDGELLAESERTFDPLSKQVRLTGYAGRAGSHVETRYCEMPAY